MTPDEIITLLTSIAQYYSDQVKFAQGDPGAIEYYTERAEACERAAEIVSRSQRDS